MAASEISIKSLSSYTRPVMHGRQRHWNIGGRRSSAEDARIEAP